MFGAAQAEDAVAGTAADGISAASAAYRRHNGMQSQQNNTTSYSEANNGGGGSSPYRMARQSPYPLPTGYYAAAAAAAASLAAVGDYPTASHPAAHHGHAAGGVYGGMDAAAAAAAWHAYNAPLGPLYQRYDQAMEWGQQDFSDPSFSSFGCGFPPPPPRPPPSQQQQQHNGDCSAPLGPPSPSEYKDFGPYVVQRVSAPANGASPDSGLAAEDSPLEAMAQQQTSSGSGSTTVKAEVSPSSAGNRPQPARSPYEWMKRPAFAARASSAKEGRTRTKDKYRVVYSDHQRLELEKEFHYSRYITIRRKAELAQALSLSERQVKIWFQNRRAKERKHMKKRDELIHKEKLETAASLHAAAAVGHAQHAMFTATAAGMFHHHHHPAMALPHI